MSQNTNSLFAYLGSRTYEVILTHPDRNCETYKPGEEVASYQLLANDVVQAMRNAILNSASGYCMKRCPSCDSLLDPLIGTLP